MSVILECLRLIASSKGVEFCDLDFALIFAPAEIKSSIFSLRPSEAAICQGVQPRSSLALTSAPPSISIFTKSFA